MIPRLISRWKARRKVKEARQTWDQCRQTYRDRRAAGDDRGAGEASNRLLKLSTLLLRAEREAGLFQ